MSTFATFLAAMQRNNVMKATAPGATTLMPVGKIKKDKDWAIASYDFGDLLNENSPAFLGTERIAEASKGVQVHKIDREEGITPDGLIQVAGTNHLVMTPRDQPAFNDSKAYAIILNHKGCPTVITGRPDHNVEYDIPMLRIEGYKFITTVKGNFWLLMTGNPEWVKEMQQVAISLLANPKIVFEMADASDFKGVNDRQRMAGKRQVPTSHIIRLTKVEKIGEADPKPHQGGTHKSPIPHDRAKNGYTRTYKKTGLTKWYPGPIKVKGGREAAGAVEYRVVP